MKQAALRQKVLLLLTVLAVLVPLGLLALFVVHKHRAAEQYLSDIEPRYARMLGLQQQRAELDAALAQAKARRAQYVYPATEDAAQTGNTAQQRVRDIFSSAGLQIISSQVLPAKTEKDMERIPMAVRAEGDLLALQSALAVLSGESPAILLDDVNIQSQNFGNDSAEPKKPTRLIIQFGLSVLREPS